MDYSKDRIIKLTYYYTKHLVEPGNISLPMMLNDIASLQTKWTIKDKVDNSLKQKLHIGLKYSHTEKVNGRYFLEINIWLCANNNNLIIDVCDFIFNKPYSKFATINKNNHIANGVNMWVYDAKELSNIDIDHARFYCENCCTNTTIMYPKPFNNNNDFECKLSYSSSIEIGSVEYSKLYSVHGFYNSSDRKIKKIYRMVLNDNIHKRELLQNVIKYSHMYKFKVCTFDFNYFFRRIKYMLLKITGNLERVPYNQT